MVCTHHNSDYSLLQSEYLPTVCTHQLIVYSIDVNVLDGSIYTVNKNKL